MYPEIWGHAAALMIFFGFNLTFFPQFILGYLGMPRRYHSYPPEFEVLNVFRRLARVILAVGLSVAARLSDMVGVLRRARAGRSVGRDRDSNGGRRRRRSTENFVSTPEVTEPPYNYAPPEVCRAMAETHLPEGFQYSGPEHQAWTAISGMWLFLATEVLFFGALFLPWIFARH